VVDKGGDHGLTYGMSFTVFTRGDGHQLEVCTIDRIEAKTAWLQYSGEINPKNTTKIIC
jgi:hypothetical protein